MSKGRRRRVVGEQSTSRRLHTGLKMDIFDPDNADYFLATESILSMKHKKLLDSIDICDRRLQNPPT